MERGHAVLLDSNLLLLLAIGLFDDTLIGRRRLDIFTPKDFELLVDLIAGYTTTVTTPHLLTELNNLAHQCVPERRHREFRHFLKLWMTKLQERWEPAAALCNTEGFAALGLADSAVVHLSAEGVAVLSIDLPLCRHLWGQGVAVLNFNHLRDV